MKRGTLALFAISSILILVLFTTFASAGFFSDLVKRITGKAIINNPPAKQLKPIDDIEGSPTCTDTDGGNKPFVLGTATNETDSVTDFCHTNGELGENYCSNGILISGWANQVDCGALGNYECQNGTCVSNNSIGTCSDSDGGLNYFVQGTGTNSTDTLQDACLNGNLAEYYCDPSDLSNNRIEVHYPFDCSNFGNYSCQNGACVPDTPGNQTTTICIDTDGGSNPFVQGTVTFQNETLNISLSDECTSINNLEEWSCGPNKTLNSNRLFCNSFGDYSCQDGACVLNQTQTHSICSSNSCITVQGPGTSECSFDSDCQQGNQTGPGNETGNQTGNQTATGNPPTNGGIISAIGRFFTNLFGGGQ